MYSIKELKKHLEANWSCKGEQLVWTKGPTWKLHKNFCILEFAPTNKHQFWIYSTAGMSLDTTQNILELHVFSKIRDESIAELLTITANYHKNIHSLGLHHTINFGRPWQKQSYCNYGFISLPYLDGPSLETFKFQSGCLHNLWLIPITENEKNFKIKNGADRLEEEFEKNQLDYLSPKRQSCI